MTYEGQDERNGFVKELISSSVDNRSTKVSNFFVEKNPNDNSLWRSRNVFFLPCAHLMVECRKSVISMEFRNKTIYLIWKKVHFHIEENQDQTVVNISFDRFFFDFKFIWHRSIPVDRESNSIKLGPLRWNCSALSHR